MADRLTEIDGRAERWEYTGKLDGAEQPIGEAVTLQAPDYDWLVARVHELEAKADLMELVLARRKMEQALDAWLKAETKDDGGRMHALMSGEVRRAREVEDVLLDAAIAALKEE